ESGGGLVVVGHADAGVVASALPATGGDDALTGPEQRLVAVAARVEALLELIGDACDVGDAIDVGGAKDGVVVLHVELRGPAVGGAGDGDRGRVEHARAVGRDGCLAARVDGE